MRFAKTALGIAVLGVCCSAGLSAFGATAPAGGSINIFATPVGMGAKGTIVVTGAIGDFGKTLTINQNGTTNAKRQLRQDHVEERGIRGQLDSAQARLRTSCSDQQLNDLFSFWFRDRSSNAVQWHRALPGDRWNGKHHRNVRLHRPAL